MSSTRSKIKIRELNLRYSAYLESTRPWIQSLTLKQTRHQETQILFQRKIYLSLLKNKATQVFMSYIDSQNILHPCTAFQRLIHTKTQATTAIQSLANWILHDMSPSDYTGLMKAVSLLRKNYRSVIAQDWQQELRLNIKQYVFG